MADAGLRDQIVNILDRTNDMTIATVRDDGFPQATTVSFASEGVLIYFGAASTSQKARNIARCNKVSLTVNLPYDNWGQISGLSIGGLAEKVTDPSEMARIGQIFLEKFPEAAKHVPADLGELALFRITPKVVSVLDYSKGFGHTEEISF